MPGQLRGEALGRADHDVGRAPGRAACRTTPGSIAVTGVPLVDRRRPCRSTARPARGPAAPGGSLRSAACRSRRATAVRACRCASPRRRRAARRSSVAEAPPARLGHLGAGPRRAAPACAPATTVPPLLKWQSMPSASATRPTSSTVPCIARCCATAPVAAVPLRASQRDRGGEQRRAPAAVAAARAEAGHLRAPAPRSAATGRRSRGSRRSTGRCSRRRRSRRRRRGRPAATAAASKSSSAVSCHNDSERYAGSGSVTVATSRGRSRARRGRRRRSGAATRLAVRLVQRQHAGPHRQVEVLRRRRPAGRR